MVPVCYLFLLSVSILWFSYYVSDIFWLGLGGWVAACLGGGCSFGLSRGLFVNCCRFVYLVVSLLVLRAGYEIWLSRFLIIAYLFTFLHMLDKRLLNMSSSENKNIIIIILYHSMLGLLFSFHDRLNYAMYLLINMNINVSLLEIKLTIFYS